MRSRATILGLLVLILTAGICLAAEREESAETFLCRDDGRWASGRRTDGNVILFLFGKDDAYCGGETRDVLTKNCGRYQVWSTDGRYYLKLTETTGRVVKMPLEIKNDYTITVNGIEFKRYAKSANEKEVERRAAAKEEDEIKREIERQEKAIRDENYRRMKDALEELDERCQKKRDELDRQWRTNFPGSSSRADILRDLEKLNKDCENERKQIRKMYGFD